MEKKNFDQAKRISASFLSENPYSISMWKVYHSLTLDTCYIELFDHRLAFKQKQWLENFLGFSLPSLLANLATFQGSLFAVSIYHVITRFLEMPGDHQREVSCAFLVFYLNCKKKITVN